jgi:ribonuclease P protein component
MRHRDDFAVAVRRGRRVGRQSIVIHWAGQNHPGPARIGFVVSKSVGDAVERNAVRRRLRHGVGELLPRIPEGSLLVVRAQPAAARTRYRGLVDELDSGLTALLRRAAESGRDPGTSGRRS